MTDRDQLKKAHVHVSKFLAKRRQNQPLLALQRSDEFKRFYTLFVTALMKQADHVAETLRRMPEDTKPVGDSLASQIPPLNSLIETDEVFQGLKYSFEHGVKTSYRRSGLIVKATVPFRLTNTLYIAALLDRAAYLLNRSSIDETTIAQLTGIVGRGATGGMTPVEIASLIEQSFPEMAQSRADMISRTELANSMGDGNMAAMTQNGVTTKSWVTAGNDPCDICLENEAAGEIPVDQAFPSGDMSEPAHPNDECYVEGGEIDLDTVDVWNGS